MRFAYLIMAHENSITLQTLLRLIDDNRNDIFIHIDAKTDFVFQKELLKNVKKSNVYFTEERIDVKWAHISQVEAEYVLFENAYKKRRYTYYHLLSGSDLPIKSQNEIHNFFFINKGKEFIGFGDKVFSERIEFIHLFPTRFRSRNPLIVFSRKLFIFCQKILKYSHFKENNDWRIKKGTNWVSISDSFVKHMLQNRDFILSKWKYSRSPDEFYKQTLAYNSVFKEAIYSIENEFEGCLRLIDWNKGKPYSWQEEDLSVIISSDKFFARKFSDKSKRLVEKIERKFLSRNE